RRPRHRRGSAASGSASSRPWTPRSTGPPAAPPRPTAPSRSVPSPPRSTTSSRRDMDDARRAVEAVARDSYGRLVAYLSSHTRDVAAAEDAPGDALPAALDTWPRD